MIVPMVFFFISCVINLPSNPRLRLQEFLGFYIGRTTTTRQSKEDEVFFKEASETRMEGRPQTSAENSFSGIPIRANMSMRTSVQLHPNWTTRVTPGIPKNNSYRINPKLNSGNAHRNHSILRPTEDMNTSSRTPTSPPVTIWSLSRSELDMVVSLRVAMKEGIPTQGLKKITRPRIEEETEGRSCERATPSWESSRITVENYPRFIHIPKNAGTTVERIAHHMSFRNESHHTLWGRSNAMSLKKAGVDVELMSQIEFKNSKVPKHPYYMCHWWHRPIDWYRVEGYDFYKNRRTFCVVRNPFSRSNSEVNFLRHLHPPNCLNSGKAGNAIKDWLRKQKQWAFLFRGKEYNYPVGDCHWIPQVDYIFDDQGCRVCDDIVYFEDLVRQLTILFTAYGFDPPFGFENSNGNICTESKAHFMEHETLEMIVEAYEMDFVVFGYSIDPEIL